MFAKNKALALANVRVVCYNIIMSQVGPRNIANIPLEDIHAWDANTTEGSPSYSRPPIWVQFYRYVVAREHIVNSFDERHQADIEQDELFRSCLQEAKDYVLSELGYASTSPVYFRPKNGKNMAEYYFDEDAIYATPPQDANDYLRRTMITSQLIHEMAHESSRVRRMFIFSETDPDDNRAHGICLTMGMMAMDLTRGSRNVTGNFFEEAFAEIVASRWREATIPGYQDNEAVLFKTYCGVELPVKYHSPDRELIEHGPVTTNAGYAAIAAYGVELISDFIGVDIFELMKLARQPATETAAKREIVKIINSVQPGLYKQLRDLKYDDDLGEFEQGLAAIKTAISKQSEG